MEEKYIDDLWNKYEPYIKKEVHKHLWKVESLGYEYEDLLHDIYILYRERQEKLNKDMRPLIFTYFTFTIEHYVLKLAKKATRMENTFLSFEENLLLTYSNEDTIFYKLKFDSMPNHIKQVISIINTDESNTFKGKRGFNNNKAMCKLLGLDRNKVNVIEETRKCLSESY